MSKTNSNPVNRYSINEAAAYLGVDPHYVRKLVREGKLPTVMVPVKPGSNVQKHLIEESDLVAWKANQGSRAGGRADGRNKFVVYGTAAEMVQLREFMASIGMPAPVMPNAGAYQKRQAAKASKINAEA